MTGAVIGRNICVDRMANIPHAIYFVTDVKFAIPFPPHVDYIFSSEENVETLVEKHQFDREKLYGMKRRRIIQITDPIKKLNLSVTLFDAAKSPGVVMYVFEDHDGVFGKTLYAGECCYLPNIPLCIKACSKSEALDQLYIHEVCDKCNANTKQLFEVQCEIVEICREHFQKKIIIFEPCHREDIRAHLIKYLQGPMSHSKKRPKDIEFTDVVTSRRALSDEDLEGSIDIILVPCFQITKKLNDEAETLDKTVKNLFVKVYREHCSASEQELIVDRVKAKTTTLVPFIHNVTNDRYYWNNVVDVPGILEATSVENVEQDGKEVLNFDKPNIPSTSQNVQMEVESSSDESLPISIIEIDSDSD